MEEAVRSVFGGSHCSTCGCDQNIGCESQKIFREVHNTEVYRMEPRPGAAVETGRKVWRQEWREGACDLCAWLTALSRAIARAPLLFFPEMKREVVDVERQGMLVRAPRVMRSGTVVLRVQGTYGVEDLEVTPDQPKDGRHGGVFPSNRPYAEHQGFFERGHCAEGPSWYKGFEQQRKCPKRGGKALAGGSQPSWKGSASRNNRDGWSSSGASCLGCSSGLSDSLGRFKLLPSWQIQAKPADQDPSTRREW